MSDPIPAQKAAQTAAEAAAIAAWREKKYPRPAVAVDLVIFTVLDTDLKVLLIRRGLHPFLGWRSLPGGFCRVGPSDTEQGEDLDETARRELQEETGLPPSAMYLEQLHTFGRAGRDVRTRVITVSYFALVRPDLAPMVVAGSDAAEAEWVSLSQLDRSTLAFDHAEILDMAVARVRGRVDTSHIAFDLVPTTFTVPELQSAFEAVKGDSYDPANFRRGFRRMLEDGLVVEAPGKRRTGRRPAKVYRFTGS